MDAAAAVRVLRWSSLCLVTLLMVAPGVTAQTTVFETITVRMGPDQFDAFLEGNVIEGADASDLRAHADQTFGDGDGAVSAEERDAFEGAETEALNGEMSNPLATQLFAHVKVNARSVVSIQVINVTFSDDILGATEDTEPFVRDIHARLVFPSTDRTRANVNFSQNFSIPFRIIDMRWNDAIYSTADAWAIDKATVEPANVAEDFWNDGSFVVSYADSGRFSSTDTPVTFDIYDTTAESAKKDKKDSPGVGMIPVGVAALGLLALRRRR